MTDISLQGQADALAIREGRPTKLEVMNDNAKLRALVAELAGVLDEILPYIKGMGLDGKADQRARAALAKAKGDAP